MMNTMFGAARRGCRSPKLVSSGNAASAPSALSASRRDSGIVEGWRLYGESKDTGCQNTEYRIEKNQREASTGFPWSFLNSQFRMLTSDVFAFCTRLRYRA